MKRIISILLLVTLCLSCFIACGGDNDKNGDGKNNKPQTLEAPVVTKGDGVAKWNKVENATKYEILINGKDPVFVDASVTEYPLLENQILKVRAVGDEKNYLTSNWSNSVYISLDLEIDEWD